MKTGIYCIRNLANGKCYIGSAALSLHSRLKHHKNALKRGDHCNSYLQASWNKHGENSFVFSILEYIPPEKCIEREQWYLDNHPSQYNLCRKAGSILGIRRSLETKDKLRLKKIGDKNPMFGLQAPNAKKVIVTWLNDGQERIFNSIQECSQHLCLKRSRISMILRGYNSDIGLKNLGLRIIYKG